MLEHIEESVVLITSKQDATTEFGSGFPIYQDANSTYFLTCAHVVEDVGGVDNIKIRDVPATVIALGHKLGCDLAVLKIDKGLVKQTFDLAIQVQLGQKIMVIGYSQNSTFVKTRRKMDGVLGDKVSFDYKGIQTNAWDVHINNDSDSTLQPGYSGSPVIDTNTGSAIAVITQRQGEGKRGHAISIHELKQVWKEMPDSLLQAEFSRIERELSEEDQKIQQLDNTI